VVNHRITTRTDTAPVNVRPYRLPEKHFLSEIFKNTCKLLKITKIQTTAYHPESNGALKRSYRTLAEYLRHYINEEQTDWNEWIPFAMFAYNTTPHSATGYTPFELRTLSRNTYYLNQTTKTYIQLRRLREQRLQELKERIRATHPIAKENVREEKRKSKEYYGKKTTETTFKISDRVLIFDETLRCGRSKKLEAQWKGPYTILEKNSGTN